MRVLDTPICGERALRVAGAVLRWKDLCWSSSSGVWGGVKLQAVTPRGTCSRKGRLFEGAIHALAEGPAG